MAAFVRVCGPPNNPFLVGYPGISATYVSLASLCAMLLARDQVFLEALIS